MAAEYKALGLVGVTDARIVITAPNGQRWNGTALESHVDGNWSTYLKTMTRLGTSLDWVYDQPAIAQSGLYNAAIYSGAAAVGATPVATLALWWDQVGERTASDVQAWRGVQPLALSSQKVQADAGTIDTSDALRDLARAQIAQWARTAIIPPEGISDAELSKLIKLQLLAGGTLHRVGGDDGDLTASLPGAEYDVFLIEAGTQGNGGIAFVLPSHSLLVGSGANDTILTDTINIKTGQGFKIVRLRVDASVGIEGGTNAVVADCVLGGNTNIDGWLLDGGDGNRGFNLHCIGGHDGVAVFGGGTTNEFWRITSECIGDLTGEDPEDPLNTAGAIKCDASGATVNVYGGNLSWSPSDPQPSYFASVVSYRGGTVNLYDVAIPDGTITTPLSSPFDNGTVNEFEDIPAAPALDPLETYGVADDPILGLIADGTTVVRADNRDGSAIPTQQQVANAMKLTPAGTTQSDSVIDLLDDLAATAGADATLANQEAILAKVNLITAGTSITTVTSPVSLDGATLTVIRGDSYLNANGNAVVIQVTSNRLPATLPDGTTVRLALQRVVSGARSGSPIIITGTVATDGATKTVRFDLPQATTSTLTVGSCAYYADVAFWLAGVASHEVTADILNVDVIDSADVT